MEEPNEGSYESLSKESLVCLASEQNDKLRELLRHFRQLQSDNESLRAGGGDAVEDLKKQLAGKDLIIQEMERKMSTLVSKTKKLVQDYVQPEKTRERGVALAPVEAESIALRAENERLQQQLESLTKGASDAAADTAEVIMLRERVKELERTVRDVRQNAHDSEVRARVAEALAGSLNEAADADDSIVSMGTQQSQYKTPVENHFRPPQPLHTHQEPQLKLSSQQVAGLAAAVVGDNSNSQKKSLNKEGYLQKQGGGWGPFKAHFKERYFELRGAQGALYYSAKKRGEQIGEIPLEQTTCAETTIRPFSFCLFGPKLQRTYILAANSNEERKKWMDAITHAAQHYTKFVGGDQQESSPGSFMNSVIDIQDASCVFDNTLKDPATSAPTPTLQDFELLVVVGVGSFGKVLKVKHKTDGQIYAMKVLQKDVIVKHHMVTHTKAEKEILEASNHPFVVKMHYAFQTRRQLVFILDFLTGGELFYHLVNEHRFSEERARFYTAEIACALEHLHSRNIIYRDLKPENLVLDKDGHVCLTDFGLAKTEVTSVTHTFCGTPQYMAPELILKQGHGRASDWWSLGVFLFEMIVGTAPFPNMGNVRVLYESIVSRPPPFPKWISTKAKECIIGTLAKDPAYRIQTTESLFATPFFAGITKEGVEQKKIPVPFVPQHKGDDTRYVDEGFKRESVDVGPNPTDSKDNATIVFDDFTFVRTNDQPSR